MTLVATRPHNLHTVVIGAGIVGAAIAFNLASRGAWVTVLDAGEPGQGTSAVSFAWINARDKYPRHYHDLNRRSLDMWDRFARRLGGETGMRWGGELRWAATPTGAEELLDRVQQLQSWGYPIRPVTTAEVKEMEPGLASGPVLAASYTPCDGQVDTGRVVRACLDRVRRQGGVVRPQTRVGGLHLKRSKAGLQQVEAVGIEGEAIPCDVVVLAGGPDSPELAALAGIELPLTHTFGATLITEPVAPLFQTVAVLHTPSDLPLQIAFRQLPGGEVMIHGGSHQRSWGKTEAEVAQVIDAAIRFLPALEGVPLQEVRRGRRPIPQDGHPILGFSQAVPNLYLAAMHSGVTLAALVGEFAAIEIVDGVRIDLLTPYRLERFGHGS